MRLVPTAILLIFSLLTSVLGQTPKANPADGDFVAGIAAMKASKFLDADAAFRRVLALEPNGLRGQLGVVQVYMAQKKFADAISFIQAEKATHPLRLDLDVMLGDTETRAGQFDDAVKVFQSVLSQMDSKTDSELAVPRGAPGATVLAGPDVDPASQSLGVLTIADQTPKGAPGLHLRLAEVYRAKGDHETSVMEWSKVAEELSQAPWVLANLAMAQETAGKKAEAVKTYRQVLTRMPGNVIVLNNLAFLLSETGGDLKEAQQYAHRAAALAPGSVDIVDTEGWIALKLGNVDDAVGTFVRLVQRYPANPDYRKHLAMALAQKGEHSPALDALMKALNAPKAAGDDAAIVELLRTASK